MTIKKHTGIVRGTGILSHTDPLAHTGVKRTAGGATPLLDAALTVVESYDPAELWTAYDFDYMYQTDDETTPVTVANGTQVVGLINGRRRSGTNYNLSQSTPSRRPDAETEGDIVGILSLDVIGSVWTLMAQSQPLTLFAQFRTITGFTVASNQYIITAQKPSLASRAMIANVQSSSSNGMYAGTLHSGSAFSSNTTYYITNVYRSQSGGSSVGYLDGVSDITGNVGTQTSHDRLYVGGSDTGTLRAYQTVISKLAVLPVEASAGEIATMEAYFSIVGDG